MHKKETVELVAGGSAAGWASKLDRVPLTRGPVESRAPHCLVQGDFEFPRPLEQETAA